MPHGARQPHDHRPLAMFEKLFDILAGAVIHQRHGVTDIAAMM
jgi:hypothetical protein